MQSQPLRKEQSFYQKPEDLRSKSGTKIGSGLFKNRGSVAVKSSDNLKKNIPLSRTAPGCVSN
jgi:hypothetical protein